MGLGSYSFQLSLALQSFSLKKRWEGDPILRSRAHGFKQGKHGCRYSFVAVHHRYGCLFRRSHGDFSVLVSVRL